MSRAIYAIPSGVIVRLTTCPCKRYVFTCARGRSSQSPLPFRPAAAVAVAGGGSNENSKSSGTATYGTGFIIIIVVRSIVRPSSDYIGATGISLSENRNAR